MSGRVAAQPDVRPAGASHHWVWAVLSLGLIVVIMHGRCVLHGLFLDDHAHYRQLKAASWTLTDLVGACRLELVGGALESWYLPECTLRFFRPVSFAFMKLLYEMFDWSPAPLHVASLLWHWAVCVLLMVLGQQLTGHKRIGWGAAALFAVHPAHIATVQWIASITEVMVTAFLLISLLCFGRWRGWFWAERYASGRRPSLGWILLGYVSFVLALGCRENAAMLPPLLLAAEIFHRTRWSRATLLVHGGFWAIVAIYVVVRSTMLGPQGIPPPPYVYTPAYPDFFEFVLNKACYYVLGEFLIVPVVPFGGLAYFEPRPLLFYGLTVLCMGIMFVAWWANRGTLGAWLGPLALGLLMVPVLPVFESPHHLYLPGVGWAIVIAMIFRMIHYSLPAERNLKRQLIEGTTWIVGGFTAFLLAFLGYFAGLAMDMGQRVEDRIAEEIITSPRPLRSGDTVYVANLPIIAHYAKYIVEARTGLKDLRFVVLTWSPRVLGVITPTELRFTDRTSFEMRITKDRYFGGPYGALVVASGRPEVLRGGERPIEWKDMRVRVLAADADGVSALRFEMGPAFDSDRVHLFWGSQARWAAQIPLESVR
ncbi:MAG: hypothetical protein ACKVS9_12565 [Phycisphaerae bacterium]